MKNRQKKSISRSVRMKLARVMAMFLAFALVLSGSGMTVLAEEVGDLVGVIVDESTEEDTNSEESVSGVDTEITDVLEEDATAVTRIEWLSALVDAFDMTVEEENYPDNYFSDLSSSDTEYNDAMVATEFGLVDVEAGGELLPNEPATREFVAHSLNLCMGYKMESDSYTFNESGSVTYPDDIQVAIEKNWFALSDGNFLPSQALTVTEKAALLETAATVKQSTVIDEAYENSWTLAEGVIDLTSGVTAEMTEENEYTLTGCTQELKEGDIYAVCIDGLPLVKKVVSVTITDDKYVVKTADVDLADAFEDIDIQMSQESDLTKTIAANENVKIEYIVGGTAEEKWQDGTVYENEEDVEGKNVSAINLTESFEIPKKVLKEYNLADGLTADITCTVSGVSTDYSANILKGTAHVSVNATVTFTCNVSLDVLEASGVAPSIELANIPLAWGIGYFKVNLELTLKGNVTFSMVEYVSVGVQYADSCFRLIKDFKKKSFTITAHAEASVGVKVTVGFNCLNILKGDLYARVGAKAELDMQTYDDGKTPTSCSHANAWLYASVGGSATFDYKIGKKGKSFLEVIYDKKNSPIRVSFHIEDGKFVNRCTRDDVGTSDGGTESSKNSNTSKSRWKYYTPANSQYGYNGTSSGIGSDGEEYTIFEYSLDAANKATITKYNGNVSALNIPSTLDGYEVVAIGNNVFANNTKLRVVVIPDSVTKLGSNAFSQCSNLSSVTLSKKITEAGQKTFYNCDALTSIEIPKSLVGGDNVIFYGDYGPFASCSSLKTIKFENGVTEICGNLFSGCDGIEEIVLPDTVTKIQVSAFQDSGLKKITVSNGVVTIGSNAFSGCKYLEEIVIPDSVTKIASGVFSNCSSLKSVILSKKLTEIGQKAFYNCDALTGIEIPKSLVGGDNVIFYGDYGPFSNCSSLKNITFEKGVTEICGNLFSGCDGIEEIVIPDTVTKIQVSAFQDSGLAKITIPESVTKIGGLAFEGCVRLEEVIIPNSVTSIASGAFSGCNNLKSVILSKNLIELGEEAFYNCDSITSVEIPKSLLSGGSGVFGSCSSLKNIIFEEGVTEICSYLFSDCDGIETIIIPDGVKTIKAYAFAGSTIKTIQLPDTLTSIENSSFKGCQKLESISIPDNVISIGVGCFNGCSSLKEIVIPDSVSDIYSSTFYDCSNLTKVKLPLGLKSIGWSAFRNSGLTSIIIPSGVSVIESDAFRNCTELQNVEFKANSIIEQIRSNAFRGCSALGEIVIPDSVYELGNYIFAECTSLVKAELGTGITSIPSYAFDSCVNLESIVIPYRVTTINKNAFTNCTKLTEITIPRATTSIASGVFSYPDKLTIYGVEGTYAETYANENGIKFVNKSVPVTSMSISAPSSTVNVGDELELVLTVEPADFTDTITWRTNNSSVATVADGVVTAVSPGSVTITALAGDTGAVKAVCALTVVQPVKSVYVTPSSVTLEGGEVKILSASVSPDNAYNKELTWTSSDETVATVTQDGVVIALKKGTAKITATAKDGSGKSDYCNVTVNSTIHYVKTVDELQSAHPYSNNMNEAWSYTLIGAESLKIGFSAETYVDDGYDFIYVYDGTGAQVGKYTGSQLAGTSLEIEGDTVKIRLESDSAITGYGFKVDSVVNVGKPVPLESISLSESSVRLQKEETIQLSVNYNPENTTVDRVVSWSSDNEAVATVDTDGNITAKGVGETVITAKVGNKTATCTVVVWEAVTDLVLDCENVTVYAGETSNISYKILPATATAMESSVVCSAEDVAAVRLNTAVNCIEITALKAGSATVTLTVDGITAECSITVDDKVYLDYQDGVSEVEAISALCGEPLTFLADKEPVREGYIFVGWYTEPEGKGEAVTSSTILGRNRTFYAFWKEIKDEFWVMPVGDQMYTGKAIKPAIQVYDGAVLLQEKVDYTVSYKNNTKVNEGSDVTKAPQIIVKGKNNYSGSVTVYFNILPQNIEESSFAVDNISVKYNANKMQQVTPVVTWNGKKLKAKTDFTVSYPDTEEGAYKEPGVYNVIVKGNGNFTGERNITLTITQATLISKVKITKIPVQTYNDGQPVEPELILKMGKKTLVKGTHYDVAFENNREVGTATAIIVGKEGYSGVRRVTFKIAGTPISKIKVDGIVAKTFNGSEQTQSLLVTLNGKTLAENKDYTVAYSKNTNVGTASMVITGKGAYTGTVKKTFKITACQLPVSLADVKFKVNGEAILGTEFSATTITDVYVKGGTKPEIEIYYGANEIKLVQGKDYVVKYAANTAVTTAETKKLPTITITGKGNYAGKLTKTFSIGAADISDVSVLVADKVTSIKMGAFISKPVFTDSDGKVLKENKDYTVVSYKAYYGDGTSETVDKKSVVSQVGTRIEVTVSGKGTYTGSTMVDYVITAKNFKGVKVAKISKIYTGKEVILTEADFLNADGTSKLTIKDGKVTKALVYGRDFTIVEGSYKNNVKKGTASVIIEGCGEYGGTMTVKFTITQKKFFFNW